MDFQWCHEDAHLLQRSRVCACFHMSVWIIWEIRFRRENDGRERIFLGPTPKPISPLSLCPYLHPVSVCSDKIFVIIVSAPLGRWTVLAVLCVLAIPSPPSTLFFIWWVVQRKVHHCPAAWRSAGTTCACWWAARCRPSRLACTAVCWRVPIRLRNAWNEEIRENEPSLIFMGSKI